jgi:membrane protease subunit HflC
MDRIIPAIIGFIILLVAFASCVFIVDQREYAIVFGLGEIKQVVTEPGLHFKLPPPFQNVQRFDRRILTIDTPDAERIQTSEKKNVMVDSYVKWRIAEPRIFYIRFQGNERGAADRMSAIIRDALNMAINKRTVNDVTSREREKIMQEIRTNVAAVAKDFGIEIVDVRIKRVDFAPEISESVFRRMEAERKRVANEQRSIGGAEGEKIRADADRQREVILAEAYREAQKVKGEGDAKSSAIYAEAFSADREFYTFYRSLEAYRTAFRSKNDMLVVDPSSEFFRFMRGSNAGSAAAARGK